MPQLKRTDEEILAHVPEALRAQVKADLANVRAMNLAFDAIFNSVFRDDADTCPRCGRKHRGGFGCTCGDRP